MNQTGTIFFSCRASLEQGFTFITLCHVSFAALRVICILQICKGNCHQDSAGSPVACKGQQVEVTFQTCIFFCSGSLDKLLFVREATAFSPLWCSHEHFSIATTLLWHDKTDQYCKVHGLWKATKYSYFLLLFQRQSFGNDFLTFLQNLVLFFKTLTSPRTYMLCT
jgi:hypothetical protein